MPLFYERPAYTDLAAEIRALSNHRDWYIENAIEGRPKILLSGPEKSGKSWLAFDLMVALQLGDKWLRRWQVMPHAKGPSVYLDGEYPSRTFASRLAAIYRGRGIHDIDDLADLAGQQRRFDSRALQLLPDDPDLVKLLRDIEECQPALIVLDPLRNHLPAGASENDTETIIDAFRHVGDLQAAGNCPVLVIHHVNKSGNYSGSRSIMGRADLLLTGKRDGDTLDSSAPVIYTATGRDCFDQDEIALPWQVVFEAETERDNPQRHTVVLASRSPEEAFCPDQASTPAPTVESHAERLLEALERKGPEGVSLRALRDELGMNGSRAAEAWSHLVATGRGAYGKHNKIYAVKVGPL